MTQRELAQQIGVSYPRVNELIHGKRGLPSRPLADRSVHQADQAPARSPAIEKAIDQPCISQVRLVGVGVNRSAHALAAAVTLLCASSLSAQAPGVPGPLPPLPGGYSAVRVELPHVRRFTLDGRAWTPAAHVDIAIGNSPNRLAASVARYPSAGTPVGGSFGGGLTFTRVVSETESPAWITWFTIGAGTVALGFESLPGSRVYEVAVSAGRAKRFTPPGIGEVLVTLAPRYVWLRMTDPPAGMNRSAERIGGSLALDVGSQGRLGGLVALDVDWSSWPPGAANQLQAAFRFGASYRFLLFPRAHPMPPPE